MFILFILNLEFQLWPEVKPHVSSYHLDISFVAVVQLLSHVWLFETPWTATHQTFLSFTISWSFLRFMSIVSMMPSNNLILSHPLLLLPSMFPSIWVFSNQSAFFFYQVAKILELWLQHQSFQWMFRVAFSRVFSSITIFLYVSVQWEAWRWAAHLGICTMCFCSHVYFLTVTQWPLQLQHFVCVPRRTKGKGPNACTCYVWTLSCEPYSVLSTHQPALCHMAVRAGKWSVLTRHGLW